MDGLEFRAISKRSKWTMIYAAYGYLVVHSKVISWDGV